MIRSFHANRLQFWFSEDVVHVCIYIRTLTSKLERLLRHPRAERPRSITQPWITLDPMPHAIGNAAMAHGTTIVNPVTSGARCSGWGITEMFWFYTRQR
jgi:hypothetical protein